MGTWRERREMVIGIARAKQFSPNSVEKDRAILEAVVNRFQGLIVSETELDKSLSASHRFLNMGRLPETIAWLKQREEEGATVLNSAYGVEMCRRDRFDALIRQHHLAVPPPNKDGACWLKRADGAAQHADDVVYCQDATALEQAKERFIQRGINSFIVQPHVKGDLVKFYGVEPTGFFRTFYPGDDGDWKFCHEAVNGKPHHYFYQKEHLRATAEMLSRLARVPIYGGDAVVTADGECYIIDFNDWPSFARCRDEAAEAIVRAVALL